jgi:two-component sensor histidine kinase
LNARRIQGADLILLAIADLTQRKKAEEGEKLLLMELEHRVKNILQNVHALLRDARKRSKTVPDRAVQFYPMNVRDRAKRVLAGIEAA